MSSTAMKIALTFTAIDAASAGISTLGRHVAGLGAAGKRAQKDFEAMATNMQAGLKGLTATFLAFEKIKPAINIAAQMEESMTTLEMSLARTGQNAAKFHAELEKVRDVAGKLQVLFPFGQKEMIDAATVLAQSGMKAKDIASPTGALYSVGALASIGKVDTKYASELMATGSNIFGVKGDELGKMADWMQKIGTTSMMHIADQKLALSEGGAAAGILKIGYKDTLTALATISQMEGGPSKAGERLAEFAQRLMGATKQEKKALKAAGLSFFDKKGVLKPFPVIVQDLQNLQHSPKFAKKTQQQQLQIWKDIFQGRGEYGAFALANTGPNSFQSRQTDAERSLEIHAKTDLALRDLTRNVDALTGTVKTAISDAFAPLLPSLTHLVQGLNDAAMAADEFAKRHPKGMKVAEEAGAGALGLGFVWSAFKVLKGLRAGGRALKSLAGLGGMGVDLVEGKAMADIARAMPVFVTNWQDARRGLGAPTVPGERAAGAAAGTAVAKAAGTAAAIGAASTAMLTGLITLPPLLMAAAEYFNQTSSHPSPPFDPTAMTVELMERYADRDSERVANAVKNVQVKPEIKNQVNLSVHVDQNGRATSSSNDLNTSAQVDLKRGDFDFGIGW